MEPQFQTSFIPKKPIVSGGRDFAGTEQSTNIFSIFSVILFIVTLILSVALFMYKQVLNNQVSDANNKIVSAKEAFQPDTIKELIGVSTRIMSVQRLLQSHIATSQIFDALQSLTLKKVSLNNFDFSSKDGSLAISMDVEAQSYNALASQSDIFSKTSFIQKPDFENFSVLSNGDITARFSATIDPTLISYKKYIDSININP